MAVKVYISNMLESWPVERQDALLAAHLGEYGVYREKLTKNVRRNRSVAALKERALMMDSARRHPGDTLYVASLACLLFDASDLIGFMAQAEAAKLTVIEMDTGTEFPPLPSAVEMERARGLLAASRTGPARETARGRAAELKKADTLRRIELVRPFWHLREPSTLALRQMAAANGKPMAPGTLKHHLGSRPEVQANYEREQNREAGREAARQRKRETKA